MKKLDLYITKKFLGTFIFMIMVIMSIAIVIDISEKLRDFTNPDYNLSFWEIAIDYYPYFFLHYVNLFSYLIIFLSVLFFTGVMAQRSEIIAILCNGVSFWRFTRPYMVVSTALLIFALFMNHLMVPNANKQRLLFESKYTPVNGSFQNINLQMNEKTTLHYKVFNAKLNIVTRMWIETWEKNDRGLYELKTDMQVMKAYGDSVSNKWKLDKVFIREINDSNEVVKQIATIDTVLSFNVKDLGQRDNIMESMTTSELVKFRNQERNKGSNIVPKIEIVLYERSAYPFATYILTLIGVAVSSRKSREGVGKNIIIGLMASVLYIFFMKMTTVASLNVGLAPIVAVWVPNVIFAVVAIALYTMRLRE